MKEIYFVDACIFLNILKKEQRKIGITPIWKSSQIVLEKRQVFLTSRAVLKEVRNKSNKYYEELKDFIVKTKITVIENTLNDYELAKSYQREDAFQESFFDYLHTATCKNLHAVLITRDRKLIAFAKKKINVKQPDDLLNSVDFL